MSFYTDPEYSASGSGFRAGYVSIVGRPNVGKSTLLNRLIEQKISIVTRKPQTTRWQIRGIKSTADYQIVFSDTPGYQNTYKSAINRYMNREVVNSLAHLDLVLFVVEAVKWYREDDFVAELLKEVSAPVVLVINKLDLLKDRTSLLPYMNTMQEKLSCAEIMPLSARRRRDAAMLERKIVSMLPEGEPLFPDDQVSDKSIRFLAAEYIREKVMAKLGDELPYSVSVTIDEFAEETAMFSIFATIWVERRSHRAIIIGDSGKMLKSIGAEARIELEKFLAKKVYLQTWVKTKQSWTEDVKALKMLGYN